MSDGLSQEEIDALMNGGTAAVDDAEKDEKAEEKTEKQTMAEEEHEAVEDAAAQNFKLNFAHELHVDLPVALVPDDAQHRIFLLQLAHGGGKAGLGDKQRLCGLGDGAALGDLDDVFQLLKRHKKTFPGALPQTPAGN